MEFRIWVETRLDGRILERELLSSVERPASGIGPEEIGLKLEEGKAVLRRVQPRIGQTQVDVLSSAHRRCCLFGRNQRVKDLRTRTARTVLGTVEVSCRLSAMWELSQSLLWPDRGERRSWFVMDASARRWISVYADALSGNIWLENRGQ